MGARRRGSPEDGLDWLFEMINALGRGLWLSAGSPEAAVALWEKYGNSGRMILNVNAGDRDARQRYLDPFEKLGA